MKKNILVTGAAGQIGSELIPALRERYGDECVIAAGHRTPLPDDVRDGGPHITLDVTRPADVAAAIRDHDIEVIYHLASILSALAEANRQNAHAVNVNGLYNVLEAAVAGGVRQVNVPSSIAAFGPDTPPVDTPNETLQRPNTLYGISKVLAELWGNYYATKLGLDVRGLRLPGIISLEDGADGRHHRLRRRHLLRRTPRGALHLLPATGHQPAHDVHAGLHQGDHRSRRGGRGQAEAPRRLQRGRRQLYAFRA